MYSSTSSVDASPASSPSSSSYTASSSSSSSSSSAFNSALHSSSASSSLFNFSSYPSYIPPSSSLASELEASVYRGIDPSSTIFALPSHPSLSMTAHTAALSLDDFASAPSFDSSYASTAVPAAHSSALSAKKQLDIPSLATLTDLSASDFPSSLSPFPVASAAPSPLSPVSVSDEPSYLERYTSFYSSTSADQLLPSLASLLTAHHIDHTLFRSKAKVLVSFQCPFLSSLTVTFILRLYRSATRPNTLLVEGQRREGCVVAFHHVWDNLVRECKVNGLCTALVEESDRNESGDEACVSSGVLGMCTLLGNKAAAASPSHPLSSASSPFGSVTSAASTQSLPSFQLDAAASSILSNLVDTGDIMQQRDALRLLSLSLLSSPSASTQCQSFLSRIARWAAPVHTAASATSAASTCTSLDDERTAQLARLMLICTQMGNTDAFARQCAHSLFELLDELVQQPPSAMSMSRVRGLRCLLQVVGQLCRAEGGQVLVPYVGSHERAVLERCAGMPDVAIQQESKAVLLRLGRVC